MTLPRSQIKRVRSGRHKPAEAAADGRVRAVVDAVRPLIDGGRFPVKSILGDPVAIEADCFTDGHDALRVMLRWQREGAADWIELEMHALGNDCWRAHFVPDHPGRYQYTVCAWVDHFKTWLTEFGKRDDPADLRVAVQIGADLLEATALRAKRGDRKRLTSAAAKLRDTPLADLGDLVAPEGELAQLAARYPDRRYAAEWATPLVMIVDVPRARFSAWYEFFPRSASATPGQHATLSDCEPRLDYIAELGFDVVYLPPIHPIGRERRKGRNNALIASPDDFGSPWAIGAAEGGHKAIHPALGTLEDFRRFVDAARARNLEVALDIAFQCAPDHPYVQEHPDWFRKRPDGSIQYAENPPKKYQDIYPFDFECDDWRGLWEELKSVFDFWISEGVTIFRVDNPHTKSFAFWEWAITEIKRAHPEVIFLAEAFTRPKVMHRLAKLGYTQSYTYFAWRNTKHELTEYFTELAHGPGRDYFRPNVWPNTPDILTAALQVGGRPAFMARFVLAATLASSYGIYGPAYELCDNAPRDAGGEEYLDSEKYQLRYWDINRSDSLRGLITLVNRARRENPALQDNARLRFFPTDNDQLICYGKSTAALDNVIVCIVNLDPNNVHSGWVHLDLAALGLEPGTQYQMHDLISDARYLWEGTRNFVRLDPHRMPAHLFRVRRHLRREQDFDYFL